MKELSLPKSVTGQFNINKLNEQEKILFFGEPPKNQEFNASRKILPQIFKAASFIDNNRGRKDEEELQDPCCL